MAGIKILDVKVVDLCSKHRGPEDAIPKNKYGIPYEDSIIACVGCMLDGKN